MGKAGRYFEQERATAQTVKLKAMVEKQKAQMLKSLRTYKNAQHKVSDHLKATDGKPELFVKGAIEELEAGRKFYESALAPSE